MTQHRIGSLIVMLTALLFVGLAGCEKEPRGGPEGQRDFEQCLNKETEALCKACCQEKAAMDYSFPGSAGESPCRCVPVP